MSDTPRTDAVYAEATKLGPGGWAIVKPGSGLCDPWELARQLERELAEARKDAERYRWLRDSALSYDADDGESIPWVVLGTSGLNCAPICGDAVDAEVDTAIANTSSPQEKG